ncbi:MAG TPA: glycerophosphodiester phosphodiesterase [Candidatus Binataceae bacterium]|nr:glycerophosphodiester phosphodiesterase [Candidatus Binataceae bacterium]
MDSDFFALARPRAIAHRGASGDYPENTMVAFEAAAAAGAPYFELDVRTTRDGVVVVSHDARLERTCGFDGRIDQLTLAQLKKLDAGWGFMRERCGEFRFRGRGIEVPTLAEVFSAFPDRHYVVEIKQSVPSLVPALLEVIERFAMGRRVLIASEHQAPIDEIRALAPALPTNFPYREIADFMMSLAPGSEPYRPRGHALQIPLEFEAWRLVTAESVAAAHRAGVEVHVWTVNDPAEMRALLALGVDGIITDYADRLLALI